MNWVRQLGLAGATLTQTGARIARLRTVCAWCRKLMHDGALPESHGICPKCAKKHFPTPKGKP